MTTFTTEDREKVELHLRAYPNQCYLTKPSEKKLVLSKDQINALKLVKYRIEDSSEDLEE